MSLEVAPLKVHIQRDAFFAALLVDQRIRILPFMVGFFRN